MRPRPIAAALMLLLALPVAAQTEELVRLELTHAAFVRDDAPEAIAYVPSAPRASRPLSIVVFLHGYTGCVEVLASESATARCRSRDRPTAGWGLVRAHRESSSASLLLIPQLAFMERSGRAGRFGRTGEAARFLEESLAALAPRLGRTATLDDVGSITLFAHSAGFETTLAILRHGGLTARVRHVVLFDALYSGREVFIDWLAHATPEAPRTLVSFATGGHTLLESRALLLAASRRWPGQSIEREDFRDAWPAPAPRLFVHRRAHVAHAEVPRTYWAETLAALARPAP